MTEQRHQSAVDHRKWWAEEHAERGLKTFAEVAELLAFLRNVDHDIGLSWSVNEDSTSIVFMIDSSDLFAWGYADCDPITAADIPEMRRAYDDLKAAGEYSYVYWPMLFLSRKAEQRVQYPQYERIPDAAKPLFKAVSDKPGYAWPKAQNKEG